MYISPFTPVLMVRVSVFPTSFFCYLVFMMYFSMANFLVYLISCVLTFRVFRIVHLLFTIYSFLSLFIIHHSLCGCLYCTFYSHHRTYGSSIYLLWCVFTSGCCCCFCFSYSFTFFYAVLRFSLEIKKWLKSFLIYFRVRGVSGMKKVFEFNGILIRSHV